MKTEKNVGISVNRVRWLVGAAILGYGLYKLLKINTTRQDIDLEPATSRSEAHPYFDPRHHRPQDTITPKNYVSDHRTRVGNGPGERNQIGGRASGKKARY